MTFLQAVRQAHADRRSGCIYVRHSSDWQISPDSDAFIGECNQESLPGYIQVFSCQYAAAMVAEKGAVVTAHELAWIHNKAMRDLGAA